MFCRLLRPVARVTSEEFLDRLTKPDSNKATLDRLLANLSAFRLDTHYSGLGGFCNFECAHAFLVACGHLRQNRCAVFKAYTCDLNELDWQVARLLCTAFALR